MPGSDWSTRHDGGTSCVDRTSDLLEDGIYELRAKVGRVNYRVLYFFHGREVAILAHGLTKEKTIPRADLKRAIARKALFEADPETHTHRE